MRGQGVARGFIEQCHLGSATASPTVFYFIVLGPKAEGALVLRHSDSFPPQGWARVTYARNKSGCALRTPRKTYVVFFSSAVTTFFAGGMVMAPAFLLVLFERGCCR